MGYRDKRKRPKAGEDENVGRIITSSVLAFLLAVLLASFSIFMGIYFGILNKSTMLSSMEKSEYYAKAEAHFYQAAEDITLPTGLPVDVIKDCVTSEQIKSDSQAYIIESMKGNLYEFDVTVLKETIAANVENYFKTQNIGEEEHTQIQDYTEMIANEYVASMKIPLLVQVGTMHKIAQKVLIVGSFIVLLFAGIAIALLMRMYHFKHRGIRYLVYASISTILMTAIAPTYLLLTKPYAKIHIEPEHLYLFMNTLITQGMERFYPIIAVWVVVTVVLLVMISIYKRKPIKI